MRPGRLVDEQSRGLQVGSHVGKFELDALKFTDDTAELPSPLTIRHRFRQGSAREPDRSRPDCRAQSVEGAKRDIEPVSLAAKHLLLRHEAIVEGDDADRVR